MPNRKYAILLIVVTLVSSAALACGACLKDIIPSDEFDRRAWDEAEQVFVAIVTGAKIQNPLKLNESNTISYTYEIQEVFKGKRVKGLRLYTRRSVVEWSAGIEMVGCGETVIVPGDRLLIFSDGESEIYIARCSSSRVIESILGANDRSSMGTILRVTEWAEQE